MNSKINPDCAGSHYIPTEIDALRASHDALLKTAKEMFDILSRTPDGLLWPNEESFSRDYVRWAQRIDKAESLK